MKNKNKLPSRFQIGDEVKYNGKVVKIEAVQFLESQVFYKVTKYRRFVHSLEVSPVEKQEVK